MKDEVTIKQLEVNLLQPCEKFPFLGMNESCKTWIILLMFYSVSVVIAFLVQAEDWCCNHINLLYKQFITITLLDELVVKNTATLTSYSIWGILRGKWTIFL